MPEQSWAMAHQVCDAGEVTYASGSLAGSGMTLIRTRFIHRNVSREPGDGSAATVVVHKQSSGAYEENLSSYRSARIGRPGVPRSQVYPSRFPACVITSDTSGAAA